MLKITTNNSLNLEQIASDHLNHFNEKYRNGLLKRKAIINKIKEEQNVATRTIEKKFLQFLLGPSNSRLKRILVGTPTDLDIIVKDFNQRFPADLLSFRNSNGRLEHTEFGKRIQKIFNYKAYRTSDICADFLIKLGFDKAKPCPYCNAEELSVISIETIKKNKKEYLKQALLDLDHFYPKSIYPFLSLSLFNLVPSCTNCNSRLKLDKVFSIETHINPYDKSFHEYFKFSLASPYYLGQSYKEMDIVVLNKKPFPRFSICDFRIVERYRTYLESIKNLLEYFYNRPQARIKEISKIFGEVDSEKEKELEITMFKATGVPLEEKEIPSYKLGKLKRDICVDIGILT